MSTPSFRSCCLFPFSLLLLYFSGYQPAFQRFENMLTWERGFEKIAALVASAKNKKAAMTQEELTNYATTWRQAQVKAFDDDAKVRIYES